MTGDIVAVFVLTVSSVGFAISFAALIFGGALESGMSRAVGSFVIANGVLAAVVGWRSRIVPAASFLQEGPVILLAAVAASFVAREGAEVTDVFVLLTVTMLATSAAFALLGHFGVGALGRCLPKSAIGAFVGGTGWLLFKGGFDVMTRTTLGLSDLDVLFGLESAKFWMPGATMGIIACKVGRSKQVPAYAAGLFICACVAGFYAVVALGSSVSAAESAGWLLGPFAETGASGFVTPAELRSANWSGIAKSTPGITSVVVLSCLAQLFHLAGIRAELAPRLDLDAEFRTSARANLAASFFGAAPGFHGFGYTVLLKRLGATRRATPVISGCLVIVFGFVGIATVGFVPRMTIGAILVMAGLALLDDWWRELMRSSTWPERILGLGLVLVVAFFGLPQGIGAALAAAGVVFIVRYSRTDPIRSVRNGLEMRSHIVRSLRDVQRLNDAGNRLAVIELQGYLFFGSVTTLENRVREVTGGPHAIEALVIDVANVTGVDDSGSEVLARLVEELLRNGVAIWVSGLSPRLRKVLLASEPGLAGCFLYSHSLATALESAEDRLLVSTSDEANHQHLLPNQAVLSPELLSHGAPCRFRSGKIVMVTNGASSDGLLVVQRGTLTAFDVGPPGIRTRLRHFDAGTVVGEVGLTEGPLRTTKVVADGPVEGWWITNDRYHELRISKPWLIYELRAFMARTQPT